MSHGPIAGDVTATSAMLWARGSRSGRLHVELRAEGGDAPRAWSAPALAGSDFTGKIALAELRPDTLYRYSVRLVVPGFDGERAGPPVEGSFRTAPPDDAPRPVRLAFGGDLAGQNVCRHASEGFPIFRAVAAAEPDLFIGLGDMIYADGICLDVGLYGNPQIPGDFGPSRALPDFWAHWRYSRGDPALRELLSGAAYVAVWDDHEVVNDFGAEEPLLPLGRAAFLDHNPVPERGLYRRLRWGRHLELFVLDTRQYRDPAEWPDDPEAPKSLLGAAQREWLLAGLVGSDATWKVVVTSVPLSIPTGRQERRDGWANFKQSGGYEHELRAVLNALRDAGVARTLWITTDVHFASVFRYTPFPEAPDFRIHEIVVGPLQAAVAGTDLADPTFGPERLFAHKPDDFRSLSGWDEARSYFNYGLLEVDADGRLVIRVLGAGNELLFEEVLEVLE